MRLRKAIAVLGLLALILAVAALLSVRLGEYPLSLRRALADPSSQDRAILWSLRVPRTWLSLLVGGALASTGAALQALMRNPLADPFVLGVSGGAALGATFALVAGLGAVGIGVWGPSAFAFLGALGATLLVAIVSRAHGKSFPERALLTGVVFNAFAAAAITCVKTLSAPEKVGEILYWLAGTLGFERLSTLSWATLLQLVALGGLWVLSGRLNLLSLGVEDARSLGVSVEWTQRAVLLLCSLSVAGAVALSGLVGFVGLIVPHLLRLWLGPDARLLIPASVLGGAIFLCLSDLGARLLFPLFHAEPPVGVVTALLGGPMFLYLLRTRERR